MHELSIASGICRAAVEHSGGRKVTFLRVRVGALSGVLADALDFCIHEVAGEAGLGEAEIIIEETKPLLKCACGREYEAADILDACPDCGGWDREIVSGADVLISELRVEDKGE
ncbi:MAG: hydrogenase maturation nickel metallochaperone HypA/HybF [Planctomycetota bacterium]